MDRLNEFGFLVYAVLITVLAIYLLYILKLKRADEKTLDGRLIELKNKVEEKEASLKKVSTQLSQSADEIKRLLNLQDREVQLQQNVNDLSKKAASQEENLENLKQEFDEISSMLESAKNDISLYQPILDLVNVGYFEEPEYLYDTSEAFKEAIKCLRAEQKKLIQEGKCIEIPESIALTTDSKYAKRVMTGQTKLMLRALNLECDNLMDSLKPSNYAKTLERIDSLASEIEEWSVSLKCCFTEEYIELKFKECELVYQAKLKQEREKEEQDRIKEQMREEQKAIRDFERAMAKAHKEEQMYKDALEAARKELAIAAAEADQAKLKDRIYILEKQLAEAEENEARAKSMAEQTRRGHIYVISNIGSFGQDVYKIGLTRRLDPQERVDELGDASVPFAFDVHAMIFSEDAPSLENQLHKEFSHARLNQVNLRKEFFKVNLLDIQKKVDEVIGKKSDFLVTALAKEYFESLKIKGEAGSQPV